MYRVMIIDDEAALRGLLKKRVPWEDLGLKVAGEASSGIEAINTIDEIRPHIVFVDIRMPFMDGIEFSRLAISRYPRLKIIVLSAYSEFEYARECIGIGVVEYLLKPVVGEEVKSCLQKVLAQLAEEEAGEPTEEPPIEKGLIQEIALFLQEQYRDAEMNLTSVAQKFGYNPSYLSRRFKAEIGKSFVDYLTSFRMEQAMKLARQGSLMYVSAKEVGILDPNYFGKCFKKYVGLAYSDYMKQAQEWRTERS